MAKRKIDKKIKEAKKLIKAIPSNPLEFAKWVMKTTVDELIKLLRPFKDDWNKYRDSTIKARINKERLVEMIYELMEVGDFYTKEEIDQIKVGVRETTAKAWDELYEPMIRRLKSQIERLQNGNFTLEDKPKLSRIYKDLMKIYHTDLGGDLEMAQWINAKIKPLKDI